VLRRFFKGEVSKAALQRLHTRAKIFWHKRNNLAFMNFGNLLCKKTGLHRVVFYRRLGANFVSRREQS
jgi:hypothetical protein